MNHSRLRDYTYIKSKRAARNGLHRQHFVQHCPLFWKSKMRYNALLSLIALLITTVNVTSGRHLQQYEVNNDIASKTVKTLGELLGPWLQHAKLTSSEEHQTENQFTGQHSDSSEQHSSPKDETRKVLEAHMIPYDFSQEPEGPYVFDVVSNGTTTEGTTSTMKATELTPTRTSFNTFTTKSTGDFHTPTPVQSSAVATVSSTTPVKNKTRSTPFTTIITINLQTLTMLPMTVTSSSTTGVPTYPPTTSRPASLVPTTINSTIKYSPSAVTTTSLEKNTSTSVYSVNIKSQNITTT